MQLSDTSTRCQSRPLNVEYWSWRVSRKWNECILSEPLGDSILYFILSVFDLKCRWNLFIHFNKSYCHSTSHTFSLSFPLYITAILQCLSYVLLNNITEWSVQIRSWVVIRQDINNILWSVRKESRGRMKDYRDNEEHGSVLSPVCLFSCVMQECMRQCECSRVTPDRQNLPAEFLWT